VARALCAGGHAPGAAPALLLALLLGACATHPGRFYADDGPPDRVPANLASVPDAVPRIEPLRANANRPYAALGRTYRPDTSDAPFTQRGFASWYGRQFHGNRTASGEPYDMFAMSAAHPTLPIPSYARVTNVRTGATVVVRINDRGPFLRDRIIDLSFAAATRLGIAGPGSGEVTVQKITAREIAGGGSAPPPPAPAVISAAQAPPIAPMPPLPPEPVQQTPTGAPTWSVQLGAFTVPANAEALRERLALLLAAPEAGHLPAGARVPRVEFDGRHSRVLIGKMSDRASAQAWAQQIQRYLLRDAVLYAR